MALFPTQYKSWKKLQKQKGRENDCGRPGINGGYILVKSPKELKISDILLALDQKVKTIGCKKDSKKSCNGKSTKCITHNFWDELDIHINSFFENKRLSDLLKNKEVRL